MIQSPPHGSFTPSLRCGAAPSSQSVSRLPPALGSCNHRSCPLCGRGATFEWVDRELAKRVGSPWLIQSPPHGSFTPALRCGAAPSSQSVSRLAPGARLMVTFTLPEELRALFFCSVAKDAWQLFFAAASEALADTLASPKWVGAVDSGFTMVLR